MKQYYSLVTKTGKNKVAEALASDNKLSLSYFAIGDGGGNVVYPDEGQIRLYNEIKRWNIQSLKVEGDIVTITHTIPPEDGGFYVREIGIFDDKNNLVISGNCPASYKPKLEEGSDKTQVLIVKFTMSNAGILELVRDGSKIVADQKWVIDYLGNVLHDHERSVNHPKATLTQYGFTMLANDINSTSDDLAATIGCVNKLSNRTNGDIAHINNQLNDIKVTINNVSVDATNRVHKNGDYVSWIGLTKSGVWDVWADNIDSKSNLLEACVRQDWAWGLFTGRDTNALGATSNLTIGSWNSVGFAPLYNPERKNINNTVVIDCRNGTVNAKNALLENGYRAVTEGRFGLGAAWLPFIDEFWRTNTATGMYYGQGESVEQPSSINGQRNPTTKNSPDPVNNWCFSALVMNAHGNNSNYFVMDVTSETPRAFIGTIRANWEGPYGNKHKAGVSDLHWQELITPANIYRYVNSQPSLPVVCLYPGGNESNPGVLSKNQRIVIGNPFGNNLNVLVIVEGVFPINGTKTYTWAELPRCEDVGSVNGRGVTGTAMSDGTIVIQSAKNSIMNYAHLNGNPWAIGGYATAVTYRVRVIRLAS